MAALLVALFTVVVGVVGLVSPASVTAVRRRYFATPTGLYTAGAVRLAMGLVVILGAPAARAPKTLRVLGALMCMQGLSATILGPEHARTVLEWETMRPALLRAGAIVALASGVFMVFAVMTGRRPTAIVLTSENVAYASDFKGATDSAHVADLGALVSELKASASQFLQSGPSQRP